MKDFGKLNFSTAFSPTSAFPLDARCVFSDLASAEAAAATAEEVGSKNTIYHYGMQLLVSDEEVDKWYVIQRDRTLLEIGNGEIPAFNLGAMGMTAVTLPVGEASVEGDTTAILDALGTGAVKFGIPVSMGGAEFTAQLIMQGFTDGSSFYQCTSLLMTEIVFFVVVVVQGGSVSVMVSPLDVAAGIPYVTSAEDGKIMQVVDGRWIAVSVADSSVKAFVDEYISSALEGDY